jgi:DNA-binding NarL/FixJ family response regulator
MKLAENDIIIVAGRTPRAKYFESLTREEYGAHLNVQVAGYEEALNLSETGNGTLFVIDLLGFEGSANQFVRRFKQANQESKLIVLHIYQSKELVEPLFGEGIDGYVQSDPSRKEFYSAIDQVLNGGVFKPATLNS